MFVFSNYERICLLIVVFAPRILHKSTIQGAYVHDLEGLCLVMVLLRRVLAES